MIKNEMKVPKYIFVTGGVVSGLGKGITAASLGRLLVDRGLKVTIQKLDLYLNVDPGTMNPYRHGEVFITDDGTEADLDLGHYERFLGVNLGRKNTSTMGQVYLTIITNERNGQYKGRDVQVVPHVTDEIKRVMRSAGEGFDVVIVEIGGTVGDIEGMTTIEAARQLRVELGANGSVVMHLTLVPYLASSGEIKTKPTQNSVRELSAMGLYPDVIVCRSDKDVVLDAEARDKIRMFCNLESEKCVIHTKDCDSIYQVPLVLKEQKLDDIVLEKLKLTTKTKGDMSAWSKMVDSLLAAKPVVNIALVGKYTQVKDSYISVAESLQHAALANGVKVVIKYVDSEKIETDGAASHLSDVAGIVVPGGFGQRGTNGKIMATTYARENKIPYLGICLGMQIAIIEFARNVAGIKDANSTEFDAKAINPIIDLINKDGTMEAGLHSSKLVKGTKVYEAYKAETIKERHRHRYQLVSKYLEQLANAGLVVSGTNEKSGSVEFIELKNHPFYVGTQYHPEFLSRIFRPHPLFVAFVKSVKGGAK